MCGTVWIQRQRSERAYSMLEFLRGCTFFNQTDIYSVGGLLIRRVSEEDIYHNWAWSRENLSSGFPTKRVSNQSPQLQRLARELKFHL